MPGGVISKRLLSEVKLPVLNSSINCMAIDLPMPLILAISDWGKSTRATSKFLIV